METMDDYKDELEASFRRINEGDIISGTVIDVNEEEVTLDLKYYAQGIIKVADLSNDPDFNIMEQVHKGDVIEATVVQTDDGAGNIVLSKKEANDILAWDKLKQMMEDETTVKVRIKESVPSGVVTYLEGIRAFIPASQITLDYVEDTDAWIGKEIEVRVITVDAEKEKLVPLYDALKENEKLNITYYYDVYDPKLWYLEVFSSMASKEQGVRYLRENYGFDFVTAFGDNTNDLPMFKAADKRVAVKNACKEVLEDCDEVTGTNEEDGVAEYLLKTFEGN